jgi:2-hydroxy-3-oxopropionate reductase
MAERLLQAGHKVVVVGHYNRAPIERLIRKGAVEAPLPSLAARKTDAALLVLPTSHEVEEVVLGEHGIADALRPGYPIVDMGTCYPPETMRIAPRVASLRGKFLDAPVTGGVEEAKAGRLTVLGRGGRGDH